MLTKSFLKPPRKHTARLFVWHCGDNGAGSALVGVSFEVQHFPAEQQDPEEAAVVDIEDCQRVVAGEPPILPIMLLPRSLTGRPGADHPLFQPETGGGWAAGEERLSVQA